MTRITTREAAALLNVGLDAVRYYAKLGYLTAITASGQMGRAQRMQFDKSEVEAFARGGAPAAAAYRQSLEGNGRPKRGRKLKV